MIFSGNFNYVLIYLIMPFVGSIAALVFYEYIFVKSQEYLEGDDDSKNSDDLSIDSEQIGGAIDPKKADAKDAD